MRATVAFQDDRMPPTSEPSPIRQDQWQPMPTAGHAEADVSFSGVQELTGEALIRQVLARNPTLAQMQAAWQAATQKIPQVSAGEDPMLMGVLAPASLGSNQVDPGYRIELSQKIYFPGKLNLKGQAASAEASAAENDVEDTRLQLVEAALMAFADYYLVDRAQEVNEEALKLLGQFRQNAEIQYKTGKVAQQDVLQADVEIGRQKERTLILQRTRKVAQARLNALMHLPPGSSLPPAARLVPQLTPLPSAAALLARAVANRPDLKALADRIAAEQAALALAHKEYCPDFEVSAAYDTIMGNGPMHDLAPQVSLKMNLPVRLAKRDAAVHEAQARIAQKNAELARQTDQVQFDVQQAYEQLVESEKILKLYDKEILPAAQTNVKAAESAYLTAKISFLSLIEAQRNLVNLKDRYYEAAADYFRRRATLERTVGSPLAASEPLPLPKAFP
jgi:outer membrane protein TolC